MRATAKAKNTFSLWTVHSISLVSNRVQACLAFSFQFAPFFKLIYFHTMLISILVDPSQIADERLDDLTDVRLLFECYQKLKGLLGKPNNTKKTRKVLIKSLKSSKSSTNSKKRATEIQHLCLERGLERDRYEIAIHLPKVISEISFRKGFPESRFRAFFRPIRFNVWVACGLARPGTNCRSVSKH